MPDVNATLQQIVANQASAPMASMSAPFQPPRSPGLGEAYTQHFGGKPDQTLQMLTYAAQLADGLRTEAALRHGGQEADPLAAPFTHGGLPTMLAGGAGLDMFKNALMKNASPGTQNTANLLQLLAHLYGIGSWAGHDRSQGPPPGQLAPLPQPPGPSRSLQMNFPVGGK
jgi:hypothetical protein